MTNLNSTLKSRDFTLSTLILGKIEGKRRRDNRGWDGWMASPTQWIWMWVNSGSWWWTRMPGVLQFMGITKIWIQLSNWTESNWMITYGLDGGTYLERIQMRMWGEILDAERINNHLRKFLLCRWGEKWHGSFCDGVKRRFYFLNMG